ncbi:Putative nucleotidyltransferase substrate binding domain protein [Corynebacterium heidelbergense]|nr:Putative nucleotidyltransferase substrate binding domain protein [Corynebacterium heidelbergense]
MREVYQSAHTVAVRFIERGAGAEEVQGVLSVAADAMARRLLRLAEEQLGPPPVLYSFVALGSQGRREMGLASDQDNALVLSEDYRPELHGEYFRQLGSSVCQGLATAGQVLYPGEMMAMTDTWRMTVGQWRETFHAWITAPEPEALLYAQTFFDMRWVHGEEELAHSVHVQAVESAAGSPRLHAHLAALATRREPPVGFFRGLVVDRRGKYANTLDIKNGGIAAVLQMARLFAIVAGAEALSTKGRLEVAAGGPVSAQSAQDLSAAFGFLNSLSLERQAAQTQRGENPDYHVDPSQLSKMERENLRDAFNIIKGMQSALSMKYPVRSV